MEARAKIFGHAIHPILIVYPLGLLSAAVIFDIIYLATGNPTWTTVSFWMIAAGIVGGLLAAVFGLIDYLGIPSGTRAASIGLLHGLTNLCVVILFRQLATKMEFSGSAFDLSARAIFHRRGWGIAGRLAWW